MNPIPEFRARTPLRAEHLRQLAELAREAITGRLVPGPGYELLQTPEGQIPTFHVETTTSEQAMFAPTLADGDNGELLVRFSPGLVEGIEPTINGEKISAPDENGDTPALIVEPGDFAPHGMGLRCIVYFRYALDPATKAVTKIEPIARATKPEGSPNHFDKVAAFLIRRSADDPVRAFPMLVFNQGFGALTGRNGGQFRPVPYASA
jgi:hypothetical protein